MSQAIILAAGEGQRLRPFTQTRPKVMLPIAGKPVIRYVIEALASCNIRQIVIVVGYCKEQIFDALGSGEQLGVEIQYVEQHPQLGTAHALMQAESLAQDDFFLLPGDNLITKDTIDQFVSCPANSILLKSVSENSTVQYGMAILGRGNRLDSIIEKPKDPCAGPVSTGIYHLSHEVFEHIDHDTGMPSVINRMINKGLLFQAVETAGPWLDAVYPWNLLHLNEIALHHLEATLGGTIEKAVCFKRNVSVGEQSLIRSGSYIEGPVLIGNGCDIGPNTVINAATTIGDNVTIGPFCHIENCIIGNDVIIGSGSTIQDSIIDNGNSIGSHFSADSEINEIKINNEYHEVSFGVMMGANCQLSNGVCAQAGTVLGNECQVKTAKTIYGWNKDKSLII